LFDLHSPLLILFFACDHSLNSCAAARQNVLRSILIRLFAATILERKRRARFDAGDNVATSGTFEIELILLELATKQEPLPLKPKSE
jgi:hypothetical protein